MKRNGPKLGSTKKKKVDVGPRPKKKLEFMRSALVCRETGEKRSKKNEADNRPSPQPNAGRGRKNKKKTHCLIRKRSGSLRLDALRRIKKGPTRHRNEPPQRRLKTSRRQGVCEVVRAGPKERKKTYNVMQSLKMDVTPCAGGRRGNVLRVVKKNLSGGGGGRLRGRGWNREKKKKKN